MLTRTRKSLLNNNDVTILNNKVVLTLPIHNPEENVVIVQRNVTRHTINQLQIWRFAEANNHNVIFFPAQYLQTKK